MKKILFIALISTSLFCAAQERPCAKGKRSALASQIHQQAREASLNNLISHELEYDVKFVHLNLNLERDTTFISGSVTIVAKVTSAVLDTFMTLLHQNYTIDSLRFNGTLLPVIRQDSIVKAKLPTSLVSGNSFTVIIYYHGTAPVGGSAIGSGFSSDVDPFFGSECAWSLSESIVAYHWWPCKQILTDKIDSSWVFVTTDSANKVGSNGLLKNVVALGNKKRFEWKSHSPIAYYLISVAVAKYAEYDLYAKPQYLVNDSVLIQNYIYSNALNDPNWIAFEKLYLDKLPPVLKLYSNLFGIYPFYKEKYGHCMAPFSGGMEHQTMTTLGGFDYYTDAHELGHQWWGDQVTCKGWGDIWMNEGFAVYSEYLTSHYLDNTNFLNKLNTDHSLVMGQPGGSIYFTDTLNANAIFDSRLIYAKGGSIIRSLQFVTNNDSVWFNMLRSFQVTYKNSNASAIDFKNYYQTKTSINPTQFFNQWYYGEGYPTFAVTYFHSNDTLLIKSIQTTSSPSVTPLFITPMEYAIARVGHPDTTVRVMQNNAQEIYSIPLTGTIVAIACDPNNWIINDVAGPPTLDPNLKTGLVVLTKPLYEMSVGPNPSQGTFTLHNPTLISGRLSVWDLAGKQIMEKKLDENVQIDLGHSAHGLYEVRVFNTNGSEIFSRKIINE